MIMTNDNSIIETDDKVSNNAYTVISRTNLPNTAYVWVV